MKKTTSLKSDTPHSLAEHLKFFGRLLANPRGIGALAPSSRNLALAMAAEVDASVPGMVLELGPGSGSITNALVEKIGADRLSVIENDPVFAATIAKRFPGVRQIVGDVFNLQTLVGPEMRPLAAIVSGIPLLNYPAEKRLDLVESGLSLLAPGAPFVQFTYGINKPVDAPAGVKVSHASFIAANLPPAHVWVYRRAL